MAYVSNMLPRAQGSVGAITDDPITKKLALYGGIIVGGLLLISVVTRKRRSNPGKWIRGSVKRPGAFRKYMRRRYGDRAFTKRGTLKSSLINDVISDPNVSPRVHRQAVLARTLKRL